MSKWLDQDGVWIGYHYDWSAFVVFANEIDALRWAVKNSASVGFMPFGHELGGGRSPLDTVPVADDA